MTAIAITDLNMNQSLDSQALSDVAGRGYSAWQVTGQSTVYTNRLVASTTISILGVTYRSRTYQNKYRQTGVRYKTTRRTVRTLITPF